MSVEVMEAWPEIVLDQYPALPGDTPEVVCLKQNAREVARIINTTMPDLERKIAELNSYKKEYEGRNGFLKWWDNDVMEEKRNEMIAVTMNSSDCQLKVVRFIAFLNVILNEQQKVLNETQKQMQTQAATIEKQQKELLEQNDQLASHQEKMDADNKAIIEGCQILQKLRNAVVEHDQKIEKQGESLTGMDKLIVELRSLYKDFEAYQRKIGKRIDRERDWVSGVVADMDKKSVDNLSKAEKRFSTQVTVMQKAVQESSARIEKKLSEQAREQETRLQGVVKNVLAVVDKNGGAIAEKMQEVESLKDDLTGQIVVLKDEFAKIRCSAKHRFAMVASLAAVSLLGLIGVCLYMVFR